MRIIKYLSVCKPPSFLYNNALTGKTTAKANKIKIMIQPGNSKFLDIFKVTQKDFLAKNQSCINVEFNIILNNKCPRY